MGRRFFVRLMIGALTLAACGSDGDSGDSTDSPEATSATTTTSVAGLAPLPAGDAVAGELLFNLPMAVRLDDACSTCHSVPGAEQGWGPVLDGVGAAAGDRVEGRSAEDYLRESIIATRAYDLEGWDPNMPTNYAQILSEQEVADLVAYLLTL